MIIPILSQVARIPLPRIRILWLIFQGPTPFYGNPIIWFMGSFQLPMIFHEYHMGASENAFSMLDMLDHLKPFLHIFTSLHPHSHPMKSPLFMVHRLTPPGTNKTSPRETMCETMCSQCPPAGQPRRHLQAKSPPRRPPEDRKEIKWGILPSGYLT